jgi:hypothetical protein
MTGLVMWNGGLETSDSQVGRVRASEDCPGSSKAEAANFLLAGPYKTALFRASRPPAHQHLTSSLPPRFSLFPTHHNLLDPLYVALPTGEAGRSSAR